MTVLNDGLEPEPEAQAFITKNAMVLPEDDVNDPLNLAARIYQLWWSWADFHLYIISPNIDIISPPILIPPETIPGTDELEFVYTIHDVGYKLSASKAEDMPASGMSMCKLFFTIEKMISLLIQRLKSRGGDSEAEVQVAFGGHELAQRKAFEVIINLGYNVVVTNFDPGAWGEEYLNNVKRIADLGYGYPSESPRDPYKKSHKSSVSGIKR